MKVKILKGFYYCYLTFYYVKLFIEKNHGDGGGG